MFLLTIASPPRLMRRFGEHICKQILYSVKSDEKYERSGDIKPAGAYKLVAFMVGKILERGGRSRLIVKA